MNELPGKSLDDLVAEGKMSQDSAAGLRNFAESRINVWAGGQEKQMRLAVEMLLQRAELTENERRMIPDLVEADPSVEQNIERKTMDG